MAAEGQRYSVLEITQVREKMEKEIDQISEIFTLSKSDATVILTRLKWDYVKASEHLADNMDQFLSKLGLVKVSDSYSSSAHLETMSLYDRDYLLSTPFCSHMFTTTRWSEYLIDALQKNREGRELISCLNQDCVASIGPDLIEKLPEIVREMYKSFTLESFMESNKRKIKWCPQQGCGYAIELHDNNFGDNSAVVCFCGHIFCWTCQLESHRPVTCNIASLWCNNLLNQAKNVSWIHTNTKACPSCYNPVEQNDDDPDHRVVTCPICSYKFCWVCLRTHEEHNEIWNCYAVPGPLFGSTTDNPQIRFLNLWEKVDGALEKAKSDLRVLEEKNIPRLAKNCGLNVPDVTALKEAGMLIVQCRQLLKWSRLFDYFTSEFQIAKKDHLQHQLDEASKILCKHEGTFHRALEFDNFTFFKDINSYMEKLRYSTVLTGNYFHGFVKNLEDGMPEVMEEAYEEETNSRWFCACCKFENIKVDKECIRCFLPRLPTPVVSDSEMIE